MTTDTQVLLAPVITRPEQGATVPNKVKVEGTAHPNAIVTIAKAGHPDDLYLKLIPEQSGHWSGTFGVELSKGVHKIQARQTLGNVDSPWSPPRAFKID
ncbi:hypothetical protein BK659_11520 [Pseudomonas brassicacearum]|uniref:Bacterial Ig-like domain-containing protein n=1 Tax=Pseudomonas brassicacearum TaxID=930166 RepID=A0A423H8M7_9PSED|nr:hypothetical protein [Pseudomonas brassicacearum]RON09543.1 hypothetical protein BK659_11520 [Pseudomonas brassicacearum]